MSQSRELSHSVVWSNITLAWKSSRERSHSTVPWDDGNLKILNITLLDRTNVIIRHFKIRESFIGWTLPLYIFRGKKRCKAMSRLRGSSNSLLTSPPILISLLTSLAPILISPEHSYHYFYLCLRWSTNINQLIISQWLIVSKSFPAKASCSSIIKKSQIVGIPTFKNEGRGGLMLTLAGLCRQNRD